MAAKANTKAPAKTAKRPAPKKAKKQTPKTSASQTQIDLRELETSIKKIDARLKRLDSRAKQQATTFEAQIEAVQASAKKSTAAQKSALTRQVNKLNKKLGSAAATARGGIEADLQAALNDPSTGVLRDVIARCDMRLDQAEAMQAEALRKVNLHVAQIARLVDAKLETERDERKAQIDQRAAEIGGRLDRIESDAADALTRVGEKVEALSARLSERQSEEHELISEKINEIALQTQADFENFKTEIQAQGQDQAYDPARFDRLGAQISQLSERLEWLEREVDSQQATPAPAAAFPAPPISEPSNIVPMAPPTANAPVPYTGAANALPAQPAAPAMAAVQPNIQSKPQAAINTDGPIEFKPAEFNPESFAPNSHPAGAIAAPVSSAPSVNAAPPAMPELEIEASTFEASELPYADPAYAETELRAERVTGDTHGQSAKKSFPISGRNLRVAGLAIAVGALGLYAGKNVLGIGADKAAGSKIVQADQGAGTAVSVLDTSETVPPIGAYSDNAAPTLEAGGEVTLLSAAQSGNPVAQYQLGLSYLQDKRAEEGAALIRQAASQNMPAAQYRLAKLYESGMGVNQNVQTARELTEQAARAGNRIAMHDLGLYYADGKGGVDKDISEAARWFQKAAEHGVVDSQFNLAVLSESGQGIEQNLETAFFWYNVAARQGDQFAQKRITILQDSLSAEQLSAVTQRADAFTPKRINEMANGIFRDLPWAKPAAKTQSVEVLRVRKVQTMLTEIGYDIGGADGAAGPRTRAAIKAFESANGMEETGRVTPDLLEKLEVAAGA